MKAHLPSNPIVERHSRVSTLFPVQALHSFGESLFALSLVGSLFFNVSIDAARPRILLYLAVTMAPFAVLGPLIGPVIDRIRGGHRMVLAASLGTRFAVAMLLSAQLKTLLFYPEAFVLLVGAKIYAVGRNSIVPSLVDERDDLMSCNAQIARIGTLAGMLGAAAGLVVLRFGGAPRALQGAAIAYGLGALGALRLPNHGPVDIVSVKEEFRELHRHGVRVAASGMAAIRFATGFSVFHIGFVLKSSSQPTWVLGMIGASVGIGGFLGTFTAPRLRRRHGEQQLLTGAIIGLAVVAGLAATWFAAPTAIMFGFALGLAGSVGRRAFDGIVQTDAPHARRGRAFAGLETRLELGWVAGALIAVIMRAPGWLGLMFLTMVMIVIGATRRANRHRPATAPTEAA